MGKIKDMLKITDLEVTVNDKKVLQGINLTVNPGETHAIMGPNGSGKSTLSNILCGHPNYQATHGSVTFEGKDLLTLSPTERALQGVFLAFQYPVEVPGVNNTYFLRMAYNHLRKSQGKEEVEVFDFMKLIKEKMKLLDMDPKFLKRGVNEDFSGGEKKRNEILQMLVLEPKLMILDETDSGLDIDALQLVAKGVNTLRTPERSCIVITHYQRLLNYIEPDFVHVLAHGEIIKTGGKELALTLEEHGYSWIEEHK